ncbi:MAG: DsbA family protein [Candidatus Promineifilaceae bacterium]
MAKKIIRKKQRNRSTNWPVIFGVIALGVIGLLALLFISIQPKEIVSLADRCAENEMACVEVGQEDAPITMVEVLDFGCPHCRDFHDQTASNIQQVYVKTGDVKFVYFPYALSAQTVPATNASLCAQEQGAYTDYADTLFNRFDESDTLTTSGLLAAASDLGLDMDTFTTCVNDGRYNSLIQDNIDIARSNGINSTPTFVLNGKILVGALPFANFQAEIQSLLAQSG